MPVFDYHGDDSSVQRYFRDMHACFNWFSKKSDEVRSAEKSDRIKCALAEDEVDFIAQAMRKSSSQRELRTLTQKMRTACITEAEAKAAYRQHCADNLVAQEKLNREFQRARNEIDQRLAAYVERNRDDMERAWRSPPFGQDADSEEGDIFLSAAGSFTQQQANAPAPAGPTGSTAPDEKMPGHGEGTQLVSRFSSDSSDAGINADAPRDLTFNEAAPSSPVVKKE